MWHIKMAAMWLGMPTHHYPTGLQMQMASVHIMKSASSWPITGQPFQFHRGWNFIIWSLYRQRRKVTGLFSLWGSSRCCHRGHCMQDKSLKGRGSHQWGKDSTQLLRHLSSHKTWLVYTPFCHILHICIFSLHLAYLDCIIYFFLSCDSNIHSIDTVSNSFIISKHNIKAHQ